jgi:SAM-dependent methyltransferase
MSPVVDARPRAPAAEFWERNHRRRGPSSGRPGAVLAEIVAPLAAGAALDLGCGQGDDAIWMATRGWTVTAVDISAAALERAAARAAESGVADRVSVEQHDLAQTFPAGEFDLVSAQYLQSPIEFPRERVLRRGAGAVAPAGLLLVVTHGSVMPWSWNQDPHQRFPTPRESLDALELPAGQWTIEIAELRERRAVGPDGRPATVSDLVIAARRRGA